MSTVDFSQLPPPSLVSELSFEVLFETRKESFIALHESEKQAEIRETLKRESEPVTKLLQENAYLEMLYVAKCNADARSLLLAYAEKSDLDHLALTEYGLIRLLVSPADDTAIPPIDAIYESDERLRERCLLSFDGMNTAGSANAYRYFALSADGRVDGIKVRSDGANPYLLDIVITQIDSVNGEASAELVSAVQKALDPDHVRPVCDRPIVKSSVATNYQIEAQLYVGKNAEDALLLETANLRLDKYIKNAQKNGESIYRSAIYAALHVDGIQRVVVTVPVNDLVMDSYHHPFCTAKTISIGGLNE